MIKLLTCDCGSSEQLVRQALHRYGYYGWAMTPITKGKSACLNVVEGLIREHQDYPALQMLFSHIKNNSKWVVVLGINEYGARWSDISHNDMKSDVDAEVIVEEF